MAMFMLSKYTRGRIKSCDETPPFEVVPLMLLVLLGLWFMVVANDMMILYLTLELAGLAIYPIIASSNDSANNRILALEGAIKYFVFNAIFSAIYLFGAALIYIEARSLNWHDITQFVSTPAAPSYYITFGGIMILVAIVAKLGAAPFHFWLPALYQAAPSFSLVIISSVKKIAIVTVIWRLSAQFLGGFGDIMYLIGVISLLFGAIGGLRQNNIRRLLGYSAINHIGFVLLSIATPYSNLALEYVVIYGFLAIGSFGILLIMEENNIENTTIDDFAELGVRYPLLGALFSIVLLSMAGIPPLAGFWVKFCVIKSMVQYEMFGGIVMAIISSAVSCYYYLKIIAKMYFGIRNVSVIKYNNSIDISEVIIGLIAPFNLLYIPMKFITLQ